MAGRPAWMAELRNLTETDIGSLRELGEKSRRIRTALLAKVAGVYRFLRVLF